MKNKIIKKLVPLGTLAITSGIVIPLCAQIKNNENITTQKDSSKSLFNESFLKFGMNESKKVDGVEFNYQVNRVDGFTQRFEGTQPYPEKQDHSIQRNDLNMGLNNFSLPKQLLLYSDKITSNLNGGISLITENKNSKNGFITVNEAQAQNLTVSLRSEQSMSYVPSPYNQISYLGLDQQCSSNFRQSSTDWYQRFYYCYDGQDPTKCCNDDNSWFDFNNKMNKQGEWWKGSFFSDLKVIYDVNNHDLVLKAPNKYKTTFKADLFWDERSVDVNFSNSNPIWNLNPSTFNLTEKTFDKDKLLKINQQMSYRDAEESGLAISLNEEYLSATTMMADLYSNQLINWKNAIEYKALVNEIKPVRINQINQALKDGKLIAQEISKAINWKLPNEEILNQYNDTGLEIGNDNYSLLNALKKAAISDDIFFNSFIESLHEMSWSKEARAFNLNSDNFDNLNIEGFLDVVFTVLSSSFQVQLEYNAVTDFKTSFKFLDMMDNTKSNGNLKNGVFWIKNNSTSKPEIILKNIKTFTADTTFDVQGNFIKGNGLNVGGISEFEKANYHMGISAWDNDSQKYLQYCDDTENMNGNEIMPYNFNCALDNFTENFEMSEGPNLGSFQADKLYPGDANHSKTTLNKIWAKVRYLKSSEIGKILNDSRDSNGYSWINVSQNSTPEIVRFDITNFLKLKKIGQYDNIKDGLKDISVRNLNYAPNGGNDNLEIMGIHIHDYNGHGSVDIGMRDCAYEGKMYDLTNYLDLTSTSATEIINEGFESFIRNYVSFRDDTYLQATQNPPLLRTNYNNADHLLNNLVNKSKIVFKGSESDGTLEVSFECKSDMDFEGTFINANTQVFSLNVSGFNQTILNLSNWNNSIDAPTNEDFELFYNLEQISNVVINQKDITFSYVGSVPKGIQQPEVVKDVNDVVIGCKVKGNLASANPYSFQVKASLTGTDVVSQLCNVNLNIFAPLVTLNLIENTTAAQIVTATDFEMIYDLEQTSNVSINQEDITFSYVGNVPYGIQQPIPIIDSEGIVTGCKVIGNVGNDGIHNFHIQVNLAGKYPSTHLHQVNIEFYTPSTGLSGGAIAGIVIGSIALIGIMGAGSYFKLKTNKRKKVDSEFEDSDELDLKNSKEDIVTEIKPTIQQTQSSSNIESDNLSKISQTQATKEKKSLFSKIKDKFTIKDE